MRLIGRRLSHASIPTNTDEVVAGYPIPSGGKLNAVHLECHFVGPEGERFDSCSLYGMSGFVIPVLDPDSGATFDAIWDAQIPKDVAMTAGGFDIDTAAADAQPEFEIGLPDVSQVMDLVSGNPIQIFQRRKMLTIANENNTRDVVDAGADLKMVTDFFTTTVRRKVRVQTPSVVLFGVSSPDTTTTTTTARSIPSESEWSLLQYLEVALENAFMSLVGLTEVGAESPYEESLAFIAELIEDTVVEQTALAFTPTTWQVFTDATFDISVPGRIAIGTLTSD